MTTQQHFSNIISKNVRISSVTIEELFDKIIAHDDLLAFERVAANLVEILPWLPKFNSEMWGSQKIGQWIEICQFVKKHPQIFNKDIIEFSNRKSGRLGPFHSNIEKLPLYCALWVNPVDKIDEDNLRYLQAHYLHAYNSFQSFNDVERYQSNIKQMSLVIRKAGYLPWMSEVLKLVEPKLESVKQFHELIYGFLPQKETKKRSTNEDKPPVVVEESNRQSNNKVLKQLAIIGLMAAYVLEIREGHKKTRLSFKEVQESKVSLSLGDDENVESSKQLTFIKSSGVGQEEREASWRLGCAPDEAYAGPEVLAEDSFLDINMGESLAMSAIRAKNYYRYIASANQLLATRWNRLNLHDAFRFLLSIDELVYGKLFKSELPADNRCQLAAFLASMYWTASDSSRAAEIRLCPSVTLLRDKLEDGKIFICLKEKHWAIPAPKIERRKVAERERVAYLENTEDRIYLPIDPVCFNLLVKWLEVRGQSMHIKSIPLFIESDAIQQDMKRLFKYLKNSLQTRITKGRVSSHLMHLLADQSTDMGDAAYVFGRLPSGSHKTALFYYAADISKLQKLYINTCNKVSKLFLPFFSFGDEINTESSTQYYPQVGKIGSSLCPRPETVSLLIKDMISAIKYHRKNHFELDSWIQFHNAFTSYCVLMLGYTTGYRAVRDPLYNIKDVESEFGFVSISDKDDDYKHSSRIVWLPTVSFDQIQAYSMHRQALVGPLSLINQELAKKLQQDKIDRPQWGNRKRPKEQLESRVPFFFYLKNKGRNLTVKSTSIKDNAGWSYSLPLNVNRHYLRSRLRKYNVDGELVNTYMGHWDKGREPHGKYSTFFPMEFRDALNVPLSKILSDDGWKTVNGMQG